ncbi:MAG: DUF1552 domain-containing protein [Planctomycetota bacterium]
MKKRSVIDRRTVLRGVAAAVSLPLLEIMQPKSLAFASDNANPTVRKPTKRVAYLYFPNGAAEGCWDPRLTAKDGKLQKLNRWMSPFEDLIDDLIIPRNIWTPRGNGHGAGTATWLTGSDYDERRIDAGGTSVDQIVAKHFSDEVPIQSLQLSTQGEGFFSKSLNRNSLSWVDAQRPAAREFEPRVIFDKMFRGSKSRLSDPNVTDQILDDARRLKRIASIKDQRKIDEYLESIRSIERRMEFASQRVGQLDKASLPIPFERPSAGIPSDHGEYLRLMFDMMTLAFWSDSTRVCTFMLDHGQSNRYFDFVDGVRGTWHALSHWRDASGRTDDDDGKTSWQSVVEKKRMYNEVVRWHHEQVAYFLKNLKSIEGPDGNLLENSTIVYGSSIADGHEHEANNLPLLIAGGRKSGKLIKYRRKTDMSRLHLSILKNLGIPVEQFGDAKNPLEELI